jgi:hypothetical protein
LSISIPIVDNIQPLGLSAMGFKKIPDNFSCVKILEGIIFRQSGGKKFTGPDMAPVLNEIKDDFGIVSTHAPRFNMHASVV